MKQVLIKYLKILFNLYRIRVLWIYVLSKSTIFGVSRAHGESDIDV